MTQNHASHNKATYFKKCSYYHRKDKTRRRWR